MRYHKIQTLTVSEDDSTQPKKVRFEEREQETIEKTSFVECKTGDINLPTGTTFAIPLGAIGTAKWFYLYADVSFKIKLNGSTNELVLAAKKPHELFVDFTQLEVVTTDKTRLTYAIGGGE